MAKPFFNKIFIKIILFSFIFVSHTLFAIDKPLQTEVLALEALHFPTGSTLVVENISFESDLPFCKDEFFYLTNLHEHAITTIEKIQDAQKMLLAKKRFGIVEILTQKTAAGYNLHFKLGGAWLFKKLSLVGVFWEKHQYHDLYLIQPGDVFDVAMHQESLARIKRHFYDRGYIHARVDDVISSDRTHKTITAHIYLKPGKRFRVSNVSFSFKTRSGKEISKPNELCKNRFSYLIINKYYSKKNISKVLKSLHAMLRSNGFIQNTIKLKCLLDASKQKIVLHFDIQLGKKQILSFEGNHIFSTKFLQEKLIGHDYPEWLMLPDIIAEQITQAYGERGYWNTEVTHKSLARGYSFKISEGPVALIKKVEVVDEHGKLLKSAASYFSSMIMPQPFNEALLTTQFEELKKIYRRNGFWDFTLKDRRIVKEYDNVYRIVLSVYKGIQRYIGPMVLQAQTKEAKVMLNALAAHQLFKGFDGKQNKGAVPFDIQRLQDQRIFLLQYFQKAGYWYAFPEFSLRTKDLKAKKKSWNWNSVLVSVTWNINEDEIVRFGKVLVRGCSKLPFKKIVREISCKEGELWDKAKIDLSRSRLKKLGIFKSIQIQPYELSKKEAEKSLMVTVLDDDPFELRFRAGYSLTSKNFLFRRESTFTGGGSFIIKNPLNIADKFTFDADISKFERNVNVEYQVPQLCNFSSVGRVRCYTNRYVEPLNLWRGKAAYEADRKGFVFVFDHEYRCGYHGAISIGNEWSRTSRVRGNLDLAQELIDKTVPYFFIEPSLVIDTLDDKLKVRKGGLTVASLKIMIPEKIGPITHRFIFEQSVFYPLVGSLIGAARFRVGHIFCGSFDQIMPIDRFFLGGPTTVRGYEKNTVPPLGEVFNKEKTEIVEYTIQGGSSMLNINLEARFPFFGALDGVMFQDFGILSKRGFLGFKEKWYPATGFGLRYNTPIGALRFDIGWKWNCILPMESRYAWYLTLGHAF